MSFEVSGGSREERAKHMPKKEKQKGQGGETGPGLECGLFRETGNPGGKE